MIGHYPGLSANRTKKLAWPSGASRVLHIEELKVKHGMLKSLGVIGLALLIGGCDNHAPATTANTDSASAAVSVSAPVAASATPVAQAAPPAAFAPALPISLNTLTLKDAGGCFLDGANGAGVTSAHVVAKAGGDLSLSGWAAARVKAGKLGSAVAVQLHGDKDYFAEAKTERREGLGAALGNAALDGAGLNLEKTAMEIPAGQYRVLFLIQSNSDLLRCDTGRTLDVQ
ncbi:hypothetical protein [Paraburkholderia ginsengiterrae]|uniref:hypothetical protein n=1 Tax=Paraburkholderia ginsengiterrae TaxID=1462993 RepID=UPI0012F7D376|nr:hypothetical protein [Paraburkholderia ginsengiterrae]